MQTKQKNVTKKGQFVTYKIKIILADQIDELIKNPELNYTTRANFIESAIRKHIHKTEQELLDKMKIKEYFKIRGA
jgi:metal-responsive CopG/Arc/MetJ family transcriptional regulator